MSRPPAFPSSWDRARCDAVVAAGGLLEATVRVAVAHRREVWAADPSQRHDPRGIPVTVDVCPELYAGLPYVFERAPARPSMAMRLRVGGVWVAVHPHRAMYPDLIRVSWRTEHWDVIVVPADIPVDGHGIYETLRRDGAPPDDAAMATAAILAAGDRH